MWKSASCKPWELEGHSFKPISEDGFIEKCERCNVVRHHQYYKIPGSGPNKEII